MKANSLACRSRRRGGFTFMEILFSVMILGIGFIMVAAMFPAALRQTQQNVEENQFNVLARTAQNDLQNIGYSTDYIFSNKYPTQAAPKLLDQLTSFVARDTNQAPEYDPGVAVQAAPIVGRPIIYSFHDGRIDAAVSRGTPTWIPYSKTDQTSELAADLVAPALWTAVSGNMINPDDKSSGWVAMWSRSKRGVASNVTAGNSLQLLIFPVKSRAKAQFDGDTTVPGSAPQQPNPACDLTYTPSNLDPVVTDVTYYPPSGTYTTVPNGVIQIVGIEEVKPGIAILPAVPTTAANTPVAEGSYVVISDDPSKPQFNGTIFRVAAQVGDPNGNGTNSNGVYWSVSEVHNLPTQKPWQVTAPAGVQPTDISSSGSVRVIALIVGRGVDPADPFQHSDSARTAGKYQLLPRTGPTQELGFISTSITFN